MSLNESFIQELRIDFLNEFQDMLQAMKKSIQDLHQDFEESFLKWHATLHTLKGNSQGVGFKNLSEILNQIETETISLEKISREIKEESTIYRLQKVLFEIISSLYEISEEMKKEGHDENINHEKFQQTIQLIKNWKPQLDIHDWDLDENSNKEKLIEKKKYQRRKNRRKYRNGGYMGTNGWLGIF